MSRSTDLGAVYAALMTGHDVGDHVVQTDPQAAGKAKDPALLAGHVLTYTATQLAAVLALRTVGVRPSAARIAAGLAVSALTHAFWDLRWPVRWVLQHTHSREFAATTYRPIGQSLVTHELQSTGNAPGSWRTRHELTPPVSDEPIRLHGPYLADQALHHGCCFLAALVISGGAR